jgi:hypothetical protein
MVDVNKIIRDRTPKRDKTKFSRPEGAANFDNMDDKNIVDQVNIKRGTVDLAPTAEKDIVNKKYVDGLVRGNVELFLTEDASDIGTYLDLAVDSTGNPEETIMQTITPLGTTLIASFASILDEAEIESITNLSVGIYTLHAHASANFPVGMSFYFEFYRRTSGGTETLIGTSHDSDVLTATEAQHEVHASVVEDLVWDTGDRVVIKVYGRNTNAAAKDVTIYIEGDTLSRAAFPAFIPPTGGTIDALSDTLITSISKNNHLIWNGTVWVNAPDGTTFTFSINSFTDNQSSVQEIGTGEWMGSGDITFSSVYTNGPVSGFPFVSHSGWSNLNMTGALFQGPTDSVEAQNYPGSPGSLTWTLNATDGEDPDTKNVSVTFYNRRHWGVTSQASGYDSDDIGGFDSDELSNSRSKTFTVTAAGGEYIVYAYRKALGEATFFVGGFEGGFESPETVSRTNDSGFTEDFYVYRSTNSGLGETTVQVT